MASLKRPRDRDTRPTADEKQGRAASLAPCPFPERDAAGLAAALSVHVEEPAPARDSAETSRMGEQTGQSPAISAEPASAGRSKLDEEGYSSTPTRPVAEAPPAPSAAPVAPSVHGIAETGHVPAVRPDDAAEELPAGEEPAPTAPPALAALSALPSEVSQVDARSSPQQRAAEAEPAVEVEAEAGTALYPAVRTATAPPLAQAGVRDPAGAATVSQAVQARAGARTAHAEAMAAAEARADPVTSVTSLARASQWGTHVRHLEGELAPERALADRVTDALRHAAAVADSIRVDARACPIDLGSRLAVLSLPPDAEQAVAESSGAFAALGQGPPGTGGSDPELPPFASRIAIALTACRASELALEATGAAQRIAQHRAAQALAATWRWTDRTTTESVTLATGEVASESVTARVAEQRHGAARQWTRRTGRALTAAHSTALLSTATTAATARLRCACAVADACEAPCLPHQWPGARVVRGRPPPLDAVPAGGDTAPLREAASVLFAAERALSDQLKLYGVGYGPGAPAGGWRGGEGKKEEEEEGGRARVSALLPALRDALPGQDAPPRWRDDEAYSRAPALVRLRTAVRDWLAQVAAELLSRARARDLRFLLREVLVTRGAAARPWMMAWVQPGMRQAPPRGAGPGDGGPAGDALCLDTAFAISALTVLVRPLLLAAPRRGGPRRRAGGGHAAAGDEDSGVGEEVWEVVEGETVLAGAGAEEEEGGGGGDAWAGARDLQRSDSALPPSDTVESVLAQLCMDSAVAQAATAAVGAASREEGAAETAEPLCDLARLLVSLREAMVVYADRPRAQSLFAAHVAALAAAAARAAAAVDADVQRPIDGTVLLALQALLDAGGRAPRLALANLPYAALSRGAAWHAAVALLVDAATSARQAATDGRGRRALWSATDTAERLAGAVDDMWRIRVGDGEEEDDDEGVTDLPWIEHLRLARNPRICLRSWLLLCAGEAEEAWAQPGEEEEEDEGCGPPPLSADLQHRRGPLRERITTSLATAEASDAEGRIVALSELTAQRGEARHARAVAHELFLAGYVHTDTRGSLHRPCADALARMAAAHPCLHSLLLHLVAAFPAHVGGAGSALFRAENVTQWRLQLADVRLLSRWLCGEEESTLSMLARTILDRCSLGVGQQDLPAARLLLAGLARAEACALARSAAQSRGGSAIRRWLAGGASPLIEWFWDIAARLPCADPLLAVRAEAMHRARRAASTHTEPSAIDLYEDSAAQSARRAWCTSLRYARARGAPSRRRRPRAGSVDRRGSAGGGDGGTPALLESLTSSVLAGRPEGASGEGIGERGHGPGPGDDDGGVEEAEVHSRSFQDAIPPLVAYAVGTLTPAVAETDWFPLRVLLHHRRLDAASRMVGTWAPALAAVSSGAGSSSGSSTATTASGGGGEDSARWHASPRRGEDHSQLWLDAWHGDSVPGPQPADGMPAATLAGWGVGRASGASAVVPPPPSAPAYTGPDADPAAPTSPPGRGQAPPRAPGPDANGTAGAPQPGPRAPESPLPRPGEEGDAPPPGPVQAQAVDLVQGALRDLVAASPPPLRGVHLAMLIQAEEATAVAHAGAAGRGGSYEAVSGACGLVGALVRAQARALLLLLRDCASSNDRPLPSLGAYLRHWCDLLTAMDPHWAARAALRPLAESLIHAALESPLADAQAGRARAAVAQWVDDALEALLAEARSGSAPSGSLAANLAGDSRGVASLLQPPKGPVFRRRDPSSPLPDALHLSLPALAAETRREWPAWLWLGEAARRGDGPLDAQRDSGVLRKVLAGRLAGADPSSPAACLPFAHCSLLHLSQCKLYRWAAYCLVAPSDHPLTPAYWQGFFALYLACPGYGRGQAGERGAAAGTGGEADVVAAPDGGARQVMESSSQSGCVGPHLMWRPASRTTRSGLRYDLLQRLSQLASGQALGPEASGRAVGAAEREASAASSGAMPASHAARALYTAMAAWLDRPRPDAWMGGHAAGSPAARRTARLAMAPEHMPDVFCDLTAGGPFAAVHPTSASRWWIDGGAADGGAVPLFPPLSAAHAQAVAGHLARAGRRGTSIAAGSSATQRAGSVHAARVPTPPNPPPALDPPLRPVPPSAARRIAAHAASGGVEWNVAAAAAAAAAAATEGEGDSLPFGDAGEVGEDILSALVAAALPVRDAAESMAAREAEVARSIATFARNEPRSVTRPVRLPAQARAAFEEATREAQRRDFPAPTVPQVTLRYREGVVDTEAVLAIQRARTRWEEEVERRGADHGAVAAAARDAWESATSDPGAETLPASAARLARVLVGVEEACAGLLVAHTAAPDGARGDGPRASCVIRGRALFRGLAYAAQDPAVASVPAVRDALWRAAEAVGRRFVRGDSRELSPLLDAMVACPSQSRWLLRLWEPVATAPAAVPQLLARALEGAAARGQSRRRRSAAAAAARAEVLSALLQKLDPSHWLTAVARAGSDAEAQAARDYAVLLVRAAAAACLAVATLRGVDSPHGVREWRHAEAVNEGLRAGPVAAGLAHGFYPGASGPDAADAPPPPSGAGHSSGRARGGGGELGPDTPFVLRSAALRRDGFCRGTWVAVGGTQSAHCASDDGLDCAGECAGASDSDVDDEDDEDKGDEEDGEADERDVRGEEGGDASGPAPSDANTGSRRLLIAHQRALAALCAALQRCTDLGAHLPGMVPAVVGAAVGAFSGAASAHEAALTAVASGDAFFTAALGHRPAPLAVLRAAVGDPAATEAASGAWAAVSAADALEAVHTLQDATARAAARGGAMEVAVRSALGVGAGATGAVLVLHCEAFRRDANAWPALTSLLDTMLPASGAPASGYWREAGSAARPLARAAAPLARVCVDPTLKGAGPGAVWEWSAARLAAAMQSATDGTPSARSPLAALRALLAAVTELQGVPAGGAERMQLAAELPTRALRALGCTSEGEVLVEAASAAADALSRVAWSEAFAEGSAVGTAGTPALARSLEVAAASAALYGRGAGRVDDDKVRDVVGTVCQAAPWSLLEAEAYEDVLERCVALLGGETGAGSDGGEGPTHRRTLVLAALLAPCPGVLRTDQVLGPAEGDAAWHQAQRLVSGLRLLASPLAASQAPTARLAVDPLFFVDAVRRALACAAGALQVRAAGQDAGSSPGPRPEALAVADAVRGVVDCASLPRPEWVGPACVHYRRAAAWESGDEGGAGDSSRRAAAGLPPPPSTHTADGAATEVRAVRRRVGRVAWALLGSPSGSAVGTALARTLLERPSLREEDVCLAETVLEADGGAVAAAASEVAGGVWQNSHAVEDALRSASAAGAAGCWRMSVALAAASGCPRCVLGAASTALASPADAEARMTWDAALARLQHVPDCPEAGALRHAPAATRACDVLLAAVDAWPVAQTGCGECRKALFRLASSTAAFVSRPPVAAAVGDARVHLCLRTVAEACWAASHARRGIGQRVLAWVARRFGSSADVRGDEAALLALAAWLQSQCPQRGGVRHSTHHARAVSPASARHIDEAVQAAWDTVIAHAVPHRAAQRLAHVLGDPSLALDSVYAVVEAAAAVMSSSQTSAAPTRT